MCSNFFFQKSHLYDIIWKIMVESGRPKMTTCRNCIICWITKATNTHSKYVILIALPQHQRMLERVKVTFYVHCLSCLLSIRIIVSGSFIIATLQYIFPIFHQFSNHIVENYDHISFRFGAYNQWNNDIKPTFYYVAENRCKGEKIYIFYL